MHSSFSPRQVARSLGIGESTVKRWCDKGLIETIRTAGGHRRLPFADVLRFIREHNHSLVSPELLDLPPASGHTAAGQARSRQRLVDALLRGDELTARQIVLNLYLAKHSLSLICDEVIAGAFHEIGNRWACQKVDVYQERRGVEIALRILIELRKTQPLRDRPWSAMGGTIEGDEYALPTAMVELVLRESEFEAVSLGTSIPCASLIRAIQESQPKLFWLSVSHIREDIDFPAEFAVLSQACTAAGTALVVGGRALTEQLRQRMKYSTHCDTMQHLEGFANALCHGSTRDNRRSG